MATHIVLVPSYIGGAVRKPGEPIDYADEPNWKFEPIDAAARAEWEATAADRLRVEIALKDAHLWDYDAPPRAPEPTADAVKAYHATMAAAPRRHTDPARYRELDEA